MDSIVSLFENQVINKKNETIDLTKHFKEKDYLLLYFSAHWCPPCRCFTPKLIEFYNHHHESKKFEVIFISLDEDEESFKDYYSAMPWLTIKFNENNITEKLGKHFGVNGIPNLVILDNSGTIINSDAVTNCTEDSKAEKFPWKE